MRPATAASLLMALVHLAGSPASAARKTVVIGAGDCRDPALLAAVKAFQDLARPQLGSDLLDPDTVLRAVRPQASRGVPELERQVETARALLYSGENERGLDMVQDALAELEKSSPLASPGPVLVQALLLEAQMLKNLDRPRDFAEAHRKVLRLDPAYRLDPDQFPPSTLQAFEVVRRELARGRRGSLQVDVTSGPAGTLYLDGRELGPTGRPLELPQGTYRVEVVLGDGVSFPHKVSLGKSERLKVSMDFEAAVATRAPLCVTDERGAQRLAATVAAQRVVVLRDGASRGGPAYWLGTLFEVRTTERVRNAGVRADQLQELMLYLFTGKPELPEEAPPPPPPPPVVTAPPPVPQAAPELVGPTPVSLAAAPPPGPRPRVLPWVALGVGAALAATGLVLYLSAGGDRSRLDFLRAQSPLGRLPDAPDLSAEALATLQSTQSNLAASLTLVGCGVGAALAGVLGLVLFPDRPTALSLTPLPQGALLGVRLRL
jgi:hypothetical protein